MKQRIMAAFLASLLAYTGIAQTWAGPGPLNLPNIGDPSELAMSPQQARLLGEAFMRNVRQTQHVIDDPEINEYIQALGHRLAYASNDPSQPFTFFVIQDDQINAFAGPGGYVGVNSGLIRATQSESELAAVLSHEIAHVVQHHLARAFAAAQKLSLPTAAALLAGILIGTRNSEAGAAAISAGLAGSAQYQINFTRADEEEADRVGMQILERAGFDPMAMPRFFQRLQQTARYYNQIPPYLADHPVTVARIADATNRAAQYPRHPVKSSMTYLLTRAKLRVITTRDPGEVADYFKAKLRSSHGRRQAAARYGYALALTATGNYRAARAQLQKLLAADRERIAYQIAVAHVDLGERQVTQSLAVYTHALTLYPDNAPLTLYYAQTLVQAGQPQKALQILHGFLRHHKTNATAYQWLGRAAGDAGLTVEAHQALAEHYYLNGQTQAAIEQLNIALRSTPITQYQTAQIKARLKQFKTEAALEAKLH